MSESGWPAPVALTKTSGNSTQRHIIAAVAGVVASVAGAVAVSMVAPFSGYMPTLLGLVVGAGVAGKLLDARAASGWIEAAMSVILAQLLLGVVIVAVASMT